MHLANHNAMWNSRKGAAFGFTTIASQAGEQLAPFLSKIVPKLYRYQFDPNTRIQQAMGSIWNSLVTDNKKTIDLYLKEITSDLVKNLTNNLWRVRESSCLAVNDLLRGRQLDDIVEFFPALWDTLLRVLDDIKESVRKAAEIACKTISHVSIKICDVNNGKSGENAVRLVLPCLLKSGLGSQVQEAREVSLQTLVKISKNAGQLLKPHIPLLVVALLESLSNLEPQMLNYLSLQITSNQAAIEKLDSARIAASKTSPMMETINLCVQYVDSSVLPELVPRLTEIIRSGIGIGTKAGCASFIISIVRQCPQDVAVFAGKLMSALLNGLGDRSSAVRKAYASAIGNVVKVAKDGSVEKLINKLKTWYMEKEDEIIRHSCSVTLLAMGQNNPDVLTRHATLALPLTFLAMHEKKQESGSTATDTGISIWEEIWLDATPGTEGGIRLYLQELVQITQTAIESQSWHTKAQAASAMSTIATTLGSNLNQPHLGNLLKALVSGLSGRTWTGKETLLKAISSVCVKCKTTLEDTTSASPDQPNMETVIDAVLKECRKDNLNHKMEAVKCLAAILESYDMDRFQELMEILAPLLEKNLSRRNEDSEDVANRDLWEIFRCSAFQSLGQAWPDSSETQELYQTRMSSLLSSQLVISTWKEQVSILKASQKFVERWRALDSSANFDKHQTVVEESVQEMMPLIAQCLDNIKYSAIRTEALELTEKVISLLKSINRLNVLASNVREKLVAALDTMTTDSKTELQERAANLKKTLQEISS